MVQQPEVHTYVTFTVYVLDILEKNGCFLDGSFVVFVCFDAVQN